MHGPSPHLSWAELACHDGTPYPQQWRNGRALVIAEAFEMIRAHFGGYPIYIGSAYRTFRHNAAVRGAIYSRHLRGDALDMHPPGPWTVEEFYEGIVSLAERRGVIRGIGRYQTFCHVDTRPSQTIVLWDGPRVVPEGVIA